MSSAPPLRGGSVTQDPAPPSVLAVLAQAQWLLASALVRMLPGATVLRPAVVVSAPVKEVSALHPTPDPSSVVGPAPSGSTSAHPDHGVTQGAGGPGAPGGEDLCP